MSLQVCSILKKIKRLTRPTASSPLAFCGDLPVALLTFEPELSWQFALAAESLFMNSAICAVFPVCDAWSSSQIKKDNGLREFQHNWPTTTGCTDYFAAVRSQHSNEKRPIRRRSHPRLTNLARGFDAAVRQNDFTSSMTRRPSRFPSSSPQKNCSKRSMRFTLRSPGLRFATAL